MRPGPSLATAYRRALCSSAIMRPLPVTEKTCTHASMTPWSESRSDSPCWLLNRRRLSLTVVASISRSYPRRRVSAPTGKSQGVGNGAGEHDVLRQLLHLAVRPLAHRPQPRERLVVGAPVLGHDDPDRRRDLPARGQRLFQV